MDKEKAKEKEKATGKEKEGKEKRQKIMHLRGPRRHRTLQQTVKDTSDPRAAAPRAEAS